MRFIVSTLFLLSLIIFCSTIVSAKPRKVLACGVCEATVDEIHSAVHRTTEKYSVQTRWRIDDKRAIAYARTEYRLMEILEKEIEPQFDYYGVVNRKSEGLGKRLVKTGAEGADNAEFTSNYKSQMRQLFKSMIDDHEEEFILHFHRETLNIKEKLCVDITKLCKRVLNVEPSILPPGTPPSPPTPAPTTTDSSTTSSESAPSEPAATTTDSTNTDAPAAATTDAAPVVDAAATPSETTTQPKDEL